MLLCRRLVLLINVFRSVPNAERRAILQNANRPGAIRNGDDSRENFVGVHNVFASCSDNKFFESETDEKKPKNRLTRDNECSR